MYFTILLTCTVLSIMVTDYSFIGYPQDASCMFNNPALTGCLEKFNLFTSYGLLMPNVLSERLYTVSIAASSCYGKTFFGVGTEQFVVEDIYSNNIYLANLGIKILNNKMFIGSNFKYLVDNYFYDDYYKEDLLAQQGSSLFNLDFGIVCNFVKNFYTGVSVQNLLNSEIGNQVKYRLPQKWLFSLGYLYGITIVNCGVYLEQQYIENRILQNVAVKFGISQELFYSKLLSCDVILDVEKSDKFTKFDIAVQTRLISNKIWLKYLWSYPVVNVKNFVGNHYVMFVYTPAKVVKKKLIYHEPEIVEKVVVVKEKKKKVEEKVPKPEYKVEISTIPSQVKPEEQKVEEKVVISTTVKEQVVTPKEEKPKPSPIIEKEYIVVYKFPLAHKVKEGETLVSIAKKYYNDERLWKKIYEANKDKIIKGVPIVGEILVIPEP